MDTIAFICTANVCRSVMAHAICVAETARRSLPIEVYSAGMLDLSGTPPDKTVLMTCLQRQTPIPKGNSAFVRDLPLESINRFFVMERQHAEALAADYGILRSRIAFLGEFDPQQRGDEIPDPMKQGIDAFERCYSRIRECVFSYLDIAFESPEAVLAVRCDGPAPVISACSCPGALQSNQPSH
jgi:protein-tyrosine-phosphatase